MSDAGLERYTRPTGAGYCGIRQIGPSSTHLPQERFAAGDDVAVTHPAGGDRLVVRPAAAADGGVLERQTVGTNERDQPVLTVSVPMQRALGVECGDDVRLYERDGALIVVAADRDPFVDDGGDDDG